MRSYQGPSSPESKSMDALAWTRANVAFTSNRSTKLLSRCSINVADHPLPTICTHASDRAIDCTIIKLHQFPGTFAGIRDAASGTSNFVSPPEILMILKVNSCFFAKGYRFAVCRRWDSRFQESVFRAQLRRKWNFSKRETICFFSLTHAGVDVQIYMIKCCVFITDEFATLRKSIRKFLRRLKGRFPGMLIYFI